MTSGDVVRLKSGGPSMTVECVDLMGIQVAWFTEAALNRDLISEKCLEQVSAREVTSQEVDQ